MTLVWLISSVMAGAVLNTRQAALMNHQPAFRMLSLKSILHFLSLAKYALSFLKSLSPSAAGHRQSPQGQDGQVSIFKR
jgi:hypothetical protein